MAIPYRDEDAAQTWVMTFISAQGTPIARRFELWALDPRQDGMVLHGGDDASRPGRGGHRSRPRPSRAAKGWSGAPGAVARRWSKADPGRGAAVAIPFLDGARVTAVVVWRF